MPDFQFKPDYEHRVGIIAPLKEDRASNKWHTVKFDPPFGSDKTVVVIPMTQTYYGAEIPGLRVQNVNHTSFQIRFDEAYISKDGYKYASDGTHDDKEEVGWVAYGFRK